ncbi:ester cyclase [Umezawaea endophytica]|uniref:Ester cyclase n=1 Tax=Umezawaea endophytica TaxID=1654476 RepID=A0A9X3A4T7_9PSEU|nr:ester cyclase [Umezawaea endophytica]MCS7483149.1 ester cyclase [Umezawaea endophytica]
MGENFIEAQYRAYLDCLNERRFDDLGRFVHDPVVHNDRRLGLAEFQDLLRRDAAEIPDLRYEIGLLVIAGDEVACRIDFECTPKSFRGLPPAEGKISFAEHVFYRYQEGRIARIWSLVDLDAIRSQLGES